MSSLYELIMSGPPKNSAYTAEDWAALGRGELDDDMIQKMLEEGYEAVSHEN